MEKEWWSCDYLRLESLPNNMSSDQRSTNIIFNKYPEGGGYLTGGGRRANHLYGSLSSLVLHLGSFIDHILTPIVPVIFKLNP